MKGAQGMSPADLIGDAIRVLKRLAAPGARLVCRGDHYALMGTGRAGRALHVPLATVDAMRRRDWLAPARDAFVLSDVGLGWLRQTVDGGDPFAGRHGLPALAEAGHDGETAKPVAINDGESPIARLRATTGEDGKPLIDEVQFLAGERLRRDFTLAGLQPRLAVDLTTPVVAGRRGAHNEISDIALAARQRFSRALAALGPGLADVAIDVCCHMKEPNAAESTEGWSDNAALVVLRIVLDRLGAHYGFVVTGKSSRTRAWRAPDTDPDTDDANDEAEKKTARDP
jgi:hypothetical protein